MNEWIVLIMLIACTWLARRLVMVWRRGVANTKQLRLEEVFIGVHPVAGETPAKASFSVLQISDIHVEHLSITPEQIVNSLEGKAVDLIALTGDYMDRRRSLTRLEPYLQAIQSLAPKYGTFAVLGNHDYLLAPRDLERMEAMFARYGVTVLKNEQRTISVNGEPLHVIGVDDHHSRRSDLERSFQHLSPGYRLVLTHDPNIVLHMQSYPFDYLMAGHFHNGQIHWPKPYHLVKMGRLARQKRVQGLHREHGRDFYISEGLGQTGVNLRFGSQPELSLHQLRIS